jgi:hypothetical protein
MAGRIASLSLVLIGMLIMALSNLTTFFHLTPVDNILATGLGAFGLVLCVLAGFVLLPLGDDDSAPMVRGLYAAILFGAGLFDMTVGLFTIFFHITDVDDATAVGGLAGGLILILVATAMVPPVAQATAES